MQIAYSLVIYSLIEKCSKDRNTVSSISYRILSVPSCSVVCDAVASRVTIANCDLQFQNLKRFIDIIFIELIKCT